MSDMQTARESTQIFTAHHYHALYEALALRDRESKRSQDALNELAYAYEKIASAWLMPPWVSTLFREMHILAETMYRPSRPQEQGQ